jgi:ADP-ribose pyrophosphatase YjhB (NUDIX family)
MRKVEMNYCRRCGRELHYISGDRFDCPNGHQIFDTPNPAVGAFILSDDRKIVTLSVRGIEPRKGMLDAFGGFVSYDESLEAALARELEEELGLQPDDYTPPHYLCSSKATYPFLGEDLGVMTALYVITLKPGVVPRPADDVSATKSFPLMEVPLKRLHDEDIRAGIAALQHYARSVL